eukprot:scaffold20118_cov67-Skeletonema_dohrnii-CCMP3373.AAC.1
MRINAAISERTSSRVCLVELIDCLIVHCEEARSFSFYSRPPPSFSPHRHPPRVLLCTPPQARNGTGMHGRGGRSRQTTAGRLRNISVSNRNAAA